MSLITYMPIGPTMNCVADSALNNLELRGQLELVGLLCSVKIPDCAHLIARQRLPICAAFQDHIESIVGWCSKKEMFRVNTQRVIAVVTNKHAFWNGAIGKLPRNTMGGLPIAPCKESPIAKVIGSACPFPTFIRFSNTNLAPKKVTQFTFPMFMMKGVRALSAAKLAPAAFDVAKLGMERLLALLAYSVGCARLGVHRKLILSGAKPQAVHSGAGVFGFVSQLYHYFVRPDILAALTTLRGACP